VRLAYLLQRLVWTVFVLLASSVVIFVIMHVVPGDPARAMVGPLGTPEQVEALRVKLGLNDSLLAQYWIWLKNAVRGDLGDSILLGQSVTGLLLARLPVTLLLSLYSLLLALLVAIPGSIVSATRKNSLPDHVGRFFALVGVAMPSFWIGLMGILLFGVHFKLLPVFGYVSPIPDFGSHLTHMILPAIALGSGYAALVYEMNRSSLIESLEQEYTRTERANGLSERRVLLKYSMRNALVPTITVIGIQVGYLMSGALLVESVFAIPGMGRLMVNAVLSRDYPVIQGVMVVTVLIFVLTNLVVDLLYMLIDPRIGRAQFAA
jgi:peptide/nickel transport system permease protein